MYKELKRIAQTYEPNNSGVPSSADLELQIKGGEGVRNHHQVPLSYRRRLPLCRGKVFYQPQSSTPTPRAQEGILSLSGSVPGSPTPTNVDNPSQ